MTALRILNYAHLWTIDISIVISGNLDLVISKLGILKAFWERVVAYFWHSDTECTLDLCAVLANIGLIFYRLSLIHGCYVPTAQGCPHGFLGKEAGGVRLGRGVGSRVSVAFLWPTRGGAWLASSTPRSCTTGRRREGDSRLDPSNV